MRKVFLALLLTAAATCLQAQSLRFIYNGDTIANGDTVEYVATGSDDEYVVDLLLYNAADSAAEARVRVATEGGDGLFGVVSVCVGMCYEGTVSDYFEMQPHAVSDGIQVHFSYEASAASGSGVGSDLFAVYAEGRDATAKEGSPRIFVRLKKSGNGCVEAQCNDVYFKTYPNPATGRLTVSYALPSEANSPRVELRNVSGQLVAWRTIAANSSECVLSLDAVPAGVYMCSVVSDGRLLQTRKVVVR